MPDEAEKKKPELDRPKSDIYVAFLEGLREYDPKLELEDVEMALGGFFEGIEWLSEKAHIDIPSFNLGVSGDLGHNGAATLFVSEEKSVILSPGFFTIAKEIRQAAESNSIAVDEIQVDLTILPGFPQITLPVRDVFRLEGVAEGVHLIQRALGLGEITIAGFEPMRDSDMDSVLAHQANESRNLTDTRRYVSDKFEIEEKKWVHTYFVEKYGKDNPYSDFYRAFLNAGK